MIDVYSWATPNGHKVHIMLEECGLRLGRDWLAHPVNIGQGDQFKPEFLKISPNNKIPALVDPPRPVSSCLRVTARSSKYCNG
jgi:GSH-dependent disulfide-bond oxidoreductase